SRGRSSSSSLTTRGPSATSAATRCRRSCVSCSDTTRACPRPSTNGTSRLRSGCISPTRDNNESMTSINRVLVTGGAGYVGAVLVPRLLGCGYAVRVLDLYLYGDAVLQEVANHPSLEQVKGDIRDVPRLRQVMPGCDAVVHLACISNDPSFELNPALGKSINYDAFFDLVAVARDSGVKRFVYASSSSVYGVKAEDNVTEELSLQPLTDYSKYKALCEEILLKEQSSDFNTVVVRPA